MKALSKSSGMKCDFFFPAQKIWKFRKFGNLVIPKLRRAASLGTMER
jgi:hypothetical protein